jgi:hypothetical protein
MQPNSGTRNDVGLTRRSKIGGVCVDRAKRIGRWGHCLVGALQGGKPKQAEVEVLRREAEIYWLALAPVLAPQDKSNLSFSY